MSEISPDNQVLIDLVCNRLQSDPDLKTVMMNLSGSRQSEVLKENMDTLVKGVNGFLKNLQPEISTILPTNEDGEKSGESNEQSIEPNLNAISDPTAPADPNSDPNPVLTDPVFMQ